MKQPATLNQVIELSKNAINRIEASMLELPTPCGEWNVRQVINHMAVTCSFAAAIMECTPPTVDRLSDDDILGADYKAGYTAATAIAAASFNAEGAMEREIDAPAGQVNGAFWASFPTWDLYVHTWDLATATRVEMNQPEEITALILAWVQQIFGSGGRNTSQIGHVISVPEEAPAMDRLVALCGRTPISSLANSA